MLPSMGSPRITILYKTAIVTAVATVASVCLSVAIRALMDVAMDWLGWIEVFLLPMLIAPPVGWIVFAQQAALEGAFRELSRAHCKLEKTNCRLVHAVSHDPLTGLLNRQGFHKEVERRLANGEKGILLLIDIDHFKSINDTFGHAAGDKALQAAAQAMRYAVGKANPVGRVGGEEFAIFLLSVARDEAEMIAEIVRRQIRSTPVLVGRNRKTVLSVSIGGAAIGNSSSLEEATRRADRRLYVAKSGGRDRVEFRAGGGLAA